MATKRILVVDDEPSNLQILIEILKQDYTMVVANSGQKAIQMAQKNPQPDLILLDVIMPDLSGYTVCEILKADPLTRSIPIIFITALNDTGDETRGFSLGAVDYITKPINPAILRARVKSHLTMEDLYQQLQTQNESLKSSLQMRKDLAHMIVHDLRNPLTSILLGCSILKMQKQLTDYQSTKVDQIASEAKVLEELIDNILVTAKLESGKLLLSREQVNLNQVAQTVVKRFQDTANSRNITITTQWVEPDPLFLVDKSLIRRLFENLLSNSLKFSPKGKSIHMETGYGEDGEFQLRVLDQGSGVPVEKQAAIFEKYETATIMEQAPQLGLGLAFCKLVTQGHEGRIFVENNQPQGAIFTIALPPSLSSPTPQETPS